MYTIYQMSGGFICEGMLQDGRETWKENTLDEAVKSLKTFAKVMNGTKIKRKDIRLMQPLVQPTIEWVQVPI